MDLIEIKGKINTAICYARVVVLRVSIRLVHIKI